MANPNLLSASSVLGKSKQQALTTTLTSDILVAASSHLYILKNIVITNIDGTNSVDFTLGIIKSGGSVIAIASTVPVSADTTIVIPGPWYLEEGDTLEGGASANSDANVTVNYLDVS